MVGHTILFMVSDFNWYLVSSLMTQWWLNSFTSPFATTWMVNANLSFLCAVCHGFSSGSSSKCIKRKPQIWFKYTICPLYFFLFYKTWATTVQGVTCALRVAGGSTATGQFRGGEGEFWSGVFQEMWTPKKKPQIGYI